MASNPPPPANGGDPFYVGYLPIPGSIKRFVCVVLVAAFVGLVTAAAIVASQQSDPGDGVWQDAEPVTLYGTLKVDPYPVLYVADAQAPDGVRTVMLVSMYKNGATERAKPFNAMVVQATGYPIHRQGRYMLELLDDHALRPAGGLAGPILQVSKRTTVELVGEIIDPKCYLGVMKPGEGKVHRACAVRCIDGGIPPMFLTRTNDGKANFYLLTDAQGNACNQAVLAYVAESVTIRGHVEKRGDMLYLKADVDRIVRRPR